MIQTKYQKEVFGKYGHTFAGLDATHNTTHYENTSLFTVIVRDRWELKSFLFGSVRANSHI